MPLTLTRVCLAASTALTAVSLAVPVHAQNITPLGRIVLGWGTEQVALDTPQATTVIDQTEIEQQQATTVGEFFDSVPGIQSVGTQRVVGQTFNIRGFGEVPAGDEGRVIVQQDGATKYYEQYRMGAFFADPSNFCNVEVLRGPASATLYGGGALGGVVRFETCTAANYLTDGQQSQLRFVVGAESNGEGGYLGLRYATMPNDATELLFSGTYRAADDYEDGNGTAISGSEFDAQSLLASVVRHLDGNRRFTMSYEIWNSDLNDTDYEQTNTSASFGTIDRRTTDQTLTFGYESAEAYGDLEVTLALSDTDVIQDDASNQGAFGGSVLFEDTDYGYQTVSLDARVTDTFAVGNTDLTLIYGATIARQNRVADSATVNQIEFHPEGVSERVAVFAQGEFDFGNGFVLVPGLRLEYQNNDPDPANTFAEGNAETLGISPKLAFTYDVNGSVGIFGSISQTERAPSLDELFSYDAPTGTAPLGEPAAIDLDPETARSIELGFTYSGGDLMEAGDAFDARVTAFYSDIEDLIERDSTDGTPNYRNIGEAEIFGVEIEAAYEAERVFGRLAYSAITGRNLSDNEVWSNTPQDSLALTLGGRAPELDLEYGWRANFYNEIDYEGAVFGQQVFPSYDTHDIFVDYRPTSGALEGLEIQFGIDNLFDEAYENSLDGDLGRGRTFRLTVARVIDW